MRIKNKLVCGLGINDLDYSVTKNEKVDGKVKQIWMCPYYNRWKDILRRTSVDYQRPCGNSYLGCFISGEWVQLSGFKGWMENQNWQGLHLDKDILVKGNKEYGPDNCVFVPAYINTCLAAANSNNGGLPIGVAEEKRIKKASSKRYRADTNTIDGGSKHLGSFYTSMEAHRAWQLEKAYQLELYISKYAKEDCFRTDVADALMKRVWDLRLDHVNGVETKSL